MKRMSLILVLISIIVISSGCNPFSQSNDTNNPGMPTKQQTEVLPSQEAVENTYSDNVQLPSEDTQSDDKSQPEIKIDTGTYQGQIDSNFIEIAISGVPEENATRVFMLFNELKEKFDEMQLSTGECIKFQYFINEAEQNVIRKIQRLDRESDDK